MASSWKIERGITTNRVRGASPRARKGTIFDPAPQRAKRRQVSTDRAVWTQISLALSVADLNAIDARADELGLSRSAFLVKAALVAAGFQVWEV